MQEIIERLRAEGSALIDDAGSYEDLEAARVAVFGRKGSITLQLRGLKDVPAEQRPAAGAALNRLKQELDELLRTKAAALLAVSDAATIGDHDLTLPGIPPAPAGSLHPVLTVLEEICAIFHSLGFTREEGPDVELDYYNFTALNFPDDHPARDIQDTFYFDEKRLLRTQTSPAQVRIMERRDPPLAVIVPGRVYRNEALDASHAAEFFQLEGLYVDRNVSLADLKTTVSQFIRMLFGENIETRFRPHFFPFTEPSVEVDMRCFACGGKGCNVCGRTGWIEIMGAGMVHPNVFASAGYEPDVYTGYAFGLGIERLTMLRYGIRDIRLFLENDLRFLKQFRGVN